MGLVSARCVKCSTNIQLDNLQELSICPSCGSQIRVRECIRNLWDFAADQAEAAASPQDQIPDPAEIERQQRALREANGKNEEGGTPTYKQGALVGVEQQITEIASIAKTGTTFIKNEVDEEAEPSEAVCLARAKACLGSGDLKGAYEQYELALGFNKKCHSAMFGKFVSTGIVQFYLDAINTSTSRYVERYKLFGHSINVESLLKYEYLIKEVTLKLKRPDAEYLDNFNILTFRSGFGSGVSLMHIAASRSNLDAFRFLFEEGVSVNVQNENGSFAIHIAAFAGTPETIRLLHSAGSNVNSVSALGYTPLMLAVLTGNKENMQTLIALGADVNGSDKMGYTPLHYAVSFGTEGKIDAIRMLAAAGANMSPKGEDGATPLHEAVANERVDSMHALISVGAEINAKNDDGKTSLHLAGRSARLDIPRTLIQNNADVNAVDNVGNTPLHIAARSGNVEIAKMMIEAGANPNVINRMNQRPITVAKLRNMDRMVTYLNQYDVSSVGGKTEKLGRKSKNGKRRGCYIATAVYGSYEAPEVLVLRQFRDEILEKSTLGRLFVKVYYFASPSVAEWLKNARFANSQVRKLLDKFVKYCENKFLMRG